MNKSFAALAAFGITLSGAAQFDAPIRLTAGGKPVRVESPGFACPAWADIDRDGINDLLVGQFSDGKIHVFKGQGGLQFAKGEFLRANGAVAIVPGVW